MKIFGCASNEQLRDEQSEDLLLEYIDEITTYCEYNVHHHCEYKKECESSPKGFYPAQFECRLSKEFKDMYTGEFQRKHPLPNNSYNELLKEHFNKNESL